MKLVLFDIDGTLVRTGRAGSRAMNRAFEELFGISGAFDGVQMAGRTDKWIVEDAAARAGIDLGSVNVQRFREQYFSCLRAALPEPARGKGVLPGVRPLLASLAPREDVVTALLTGNCEEGARIKLQYFDLWDFFRCGAFGDDVHDRNDLFAVALQQAEACGLPPFDPRDVTIIGDTVLDVACAKAAGAIAVAVATGPADLDTLRQTGADLVLNDLSAPAPLLRLLST